VLEKRLKKGMKEMNPKSIHGIVMNPNTGEILAMASYPSFDPTNYQESKSSTWNNSPATFVYEPGSTFKPTFMAQALEQGTITPEFHSYDSLGYVNVQGSNIKNWDGRPLGEYDLKEVIQTSSNVGMIAISKTMTSKQIVNGLKNAGFGAKTGIELPGEEIGLFPTAKSLDDDPIRKATVSFGQGLSTTPVQLISAFSTLINGGYEVKPKLVESVKDDFGNTLYESAGGTRKRVYSQKTVDAMKSYLHFNQTDGSGKDYQIDGYDGGAKTGSAWVVENGAYKRGVIIGSFIGFAPLDNPQYAMLVVVDQPNGIEFGGPSAGPIYHDVMEEILRYKSVKKKNEKATKSISVPDVKWELADDAKEELESKVENVKVKIKGKGQVVVDQSYSIKNNILSVTLQTKEIKSGNEYNIPSLIGKTEAEAKKMLKPYKVDAVFHGEGVIKEQDVEPGEYKTVKEINFWAK
jgi:stage V sporulation protein D (sporulation-specific penicillin-binding protein)